MVQSVGWQSDRPQCLAIGVALAPTRLCSQPRLVWPGRSRAIGNGSDC
jgi:hypothetical protein